MSEPLSDFVARFQWRFVFSAQDAAIDTEDDVAGEDAEAHDGDLGGNDGYVIVYDSDRFSDNKDDGMKDEGFAENTSSVDFTT